jgi:hypothetical protein
MVVGQPGTSPSLVDEFPAHSYLASFSAGLPE